ncbi:DUF3891 family protein [Mucilaginibacter sp. KACC 22063]|uniref:DUF3891 family protein n=1 Tax=Mucilaginibacter sp. KACC 22063 TaxID=3025666 RepID=UPI002365B393|nr:DUF3891 family protein [Mucilaginibacter sp. KACC 22063]WDF56482.1 DUF3891 family protein [Mucilaginibacter sp. KACC 22063]
MIVNYTEQGWEIITQRAHGLLAAQLAMQWKTVNRPKRWTETVIAIAGHDDAQTELDEDDLLTPQGGPVNFDMKLFEAERCKRLLDFSLSRSRYTALLASMHMSFLYQKEANKPEVKAFLKEQQALQKQWCKQLNISQAEADNIYGFLEWCDAFSLLLCRHEVQPEHRLIEISKGGGEHCYTLQQGKKGELDVSPWPFEVNEFEVQIEYRIIPQLQFKNPQDFRTQFLKAEVQERSWVLKNQNTAQHASK